MIDQTTTAILILFFGVLAWCCWVTVLYFQMWRRTRELERDNYRLIRRLGLYHSVSLGVAEEALPLPLVENTIPPAFRTKRPEPPPNWHPDSIPVMIQRSQKDEE